MVNREPSGARDGHQGEMKRIEDMSARQVCFSKRRNGLFKKASELSTLCGAEVAILVNSPAGRPYTFGSPAVNPIINKFLSNNSDEPDHGFSDLMGSSNNPNPLQNTIINHLNQQFNELSSHLDAAKFQRVMLENRLKQAAEAAPMCNWNEKIEQLELDQLKQLLESLYQIKARVIARQNELICAGDQASSSQIVNYPDPLASMMMANDITFANQMVQQHEPTMLNSQQPSFNPSLEVGLNRNVTPATSSMTNFNPRSYGESCDYVVGGSSKLEECVPPSTCGFSLGSIRSEMYPMNLAAVNEGLIRFNSFPFDNKDADAEASKEYDLTTFLPLEHFGSTTQEQFIPQIDDTFDRNLHDMDFTARNQVDPGASGSNTNGSPAPRENEDFM